MNIWKAESASYVLKMVSKEWYQLDVMTILPERSKNIRIQIIIIFFKSSTKLTGIVMNERSHRTVNMFLLVLLTV